MPWDGMILPQPLQAKHIWLHTDMYRLRLIIYLEFAGTILHRISLPPPQSVILSSIIQTLALPFKVLLGGLMWGNWYIIIGFASKFGCNSPFLSSCQLFPWYQIYILKIFLTFYCFYWGEQKYFTASRYYSKVFFRLSGDKMRQVLVIKTWISIWFVLMTRH